MAHVTRSALAAAITVAGVAFTTTAQAALVEYDFEASINSAYGSSAVLDAKGIPTSGQLTGSISYDSEGGVSTFWGDTLVYSFGEGALDLTINEVDVDAEGVWLYASAYADTVAAGEIGLDEQVWVTLYLPNQDVRAGSLPTSLQLTNGASITVATCNAGVRAGLTSLTASNAVPELDPASGAAAFALVLGGVALIAARRRRQVLEG
ncbi:MAG: hypothetical protein JW751_07360 [Polyangiaceae bacterium]|nr:hypothetical protein [Polyangiaceae bacterium]